MLTTPSQPARALPAADAHGRATDWAYRGNQPKSTQALAAWHGLAVREPVIEPALEIIDPHHHLYDDPPNGNHYLLPDLLADIGGGHNVVATIYVEAYGSMWRASGPDAMRPVGEVEFAAGMAAIGASAIYGPCAVAAGIVGHADLALGDPVRPVLEAQVHAGQGRLRGVRYQAASDTGHVGRFIKRRVPQFLLADATFRRGFAQLADFDLSFDAWLLHHQLDELQALAAAFPGTTIVLNHAGGLMNVAEHRDHYAENLARWRTSLRRLAAHDNVMLKIGGMGMAVFGFGFEQAARPAGSAALVQAWKPYIDTCIDSFGPRRCMFESNFPVDRQSCSYTALWNAFKLATADMAPAERGELFSGTARRVYRLPEPASPTARSP
ncbi:MAG: amidohydrolase [Rhodoferax sp.]|nr:amidohydrolase [Rhodoferax sp.]